MRQWWTDHEQNSKLEQIDLATFKEIVADAPPHRDITEIIEHHSWSPTAAQYKDRETWVGIDRYHQEVRGWSDIGYHIGIGPDGSIWLLRPLPRSGGHTKGHNSHSIGICMIGNYDEGRDDPTTPLATAADVTRALIERYDLTANDVWFHRDFANKSCPGSAIDREQFRNMVRMPGAAVAADLHGDPDSPETGVFVGGKHVGNLVMVGSAAYGPVRGMAEALGAKVEWKEGRVDVTP